MIHIYIPETEYRFDLIGQWFNEFNYRMLANFNQDAHTWYFKFADPKEAAHFRLTWGGVVVYD